MARNEILFDAICTGNKSGAVAAAQAALDAGETVDALMNESLIPAMRQVGKRFECGEAFVPEMLIAARAMDAVLKILGPHLAYAGSQSKGRVCVGTVRGDMHDIGKNLVAMMLRGAGYEVDDLGVDCPPEKYVEAVGRGAQAVCLSALLVTTMPAMNDAIVLLRGQGIDVPVIIGGAPITQKFADEIGAQGYSETASGAVGVVDACLGASAA
ncbi:MAG: corrinoid protein [Planctomycetales bacterium]|nr:corrinoid protein [Planctomycetales bacterium]